MNLAVELAERAVLPDWAIRAGVRSLLRSRLRQEERTSEGRFDEANRRLADRLRQGPIAIRTTAANEQHYEVPAEFFDLVLGQWNKYSSAYWPQGV
ncbi:MAG: SAM-dependent methyltransferase, partial [Acidobacteriota bacterium]|nr:SAM-dependent methyltransferase [Acidobacteriota bacterium]